MNIRQCLLPVIQKQKLKKVILFGSRARGDNRSDSDYDFYVDAPEIKDMFAFNGLYIEFENALHSSVDIVLTPDSYTKIDDYILEAIDRDGVQIYG